MILLLAAPAAWAGPVRDAVIDEPGVTAARISATASAARYPVNDGSGATIAVAVTSACQVSCNAADQQQIAGFLGTLIHGPEIGLLTVQLDAPFQIEFDCGYSAQACYIPSEDKIVISGSDTLAHDGASREFVLAHEYGHHLASHRESPAPFPAAIEWGTPRWSSHERVCQAHRRGAVAPGNEGLSYYENPGEAFAEAFARYHFRQDAPRWKWRGFLEPDATAFRAIREDTLEPWQGRTAFRVEGRTPTRGRAAVRTFRTPLDGTVSLRPADAPRRYQLSLKSLSGRILRSSLQGLSFRRQLNFTICGQSSLNLQLRAIRRAGTPFQLLIQRP